ncbi:MAG: hypothetical protein FJ388_09005, partial [Verrucomicrobia bacterium]|nr:hypothetical protein [Verrucomicrobiota bacterium]
MKTTKPVVLNPTSSKWKPAPGARQSIRRSGLARVGCLLATTLLWLTAATGARAQALTFTNTTAGFWSAVGNWVGASQPTNGGNTNFVINLDLVSGTTNFVSVTNDLAGPSTNFFLNQLNFNNNKNVRLAFFSGTNLVFAIGGSGALPQINLNALSTNAIAANIILSNTVVVGGSFAPVIPERMTNSMLIFSNLISGAGGILMTGRYTVVLQASNNFTGGTIVSNGILRLGGSNSLGNPTPIYSVQVFGTNAALDLNAADIANATMVNTRTVFISGMGLGPQTGIIFNSSGTALSGKGLRNVQMGANSAIGQMGGQRFDIIGQLHGGGFSLYKVGNNETWMQTGNQITNMVSIVVSNGYFGLQGTANLSGSYGTAIQVWTGAILGTYTSLATFTNSLELRGGSLVNVGGGITTWDGPIALSGSSNFFGSAAGPLLLGGNISGTGQFYKTTLGLVTLGGTNTYSGATIASNGVLQFNNAAAVSTNSLITIGPAGVVQFAFANMQSGLSRVDSNSSVGVIGLTPSNFNDNINLNAVGLSNVTLGAGYYISTVILGLPVTNSNVRFNGTLTPFGTTYNLGGGGGTLIITSGALTNLGPGGSTVANLQVGKPVGTLAQPGTVWLDGNNLYTGGTILNSNATLSIFSENNIGGAGSMLTFSGGTLQVRGTTLTSLDNLTVNWTNVTGGTTGFLGGLDINNLGNVFTVTQDIIGVGITNKLGMGALVLAGSNRPTGSLDARLGVVRIQSTNALGVAGSPTVLIRAGAELQLSNNVVFAPVPLNIAGGGAYAPFGGASVYGGDGALRNVSGINTNTGPITLGGAARINADAGTTLYLAGKITNAANLITFGGYGDIFVTNGIQGGTGGLVKDGSGNLTLARVTNNFGATMIGAGTLQLDYSLGTIVSNMVFTGSVVALGTNAFSITTGGFLVVNGPAAGGMTQTFAGVIINPGNNRIIASNNGGNIILRLDNIIRAQGGGNLDLTLPSAGAFVTALSNNYSGLLGQAGALGANVLVTIDGTDWARAINFGAGSLTNNIARYTAYTDVDGSLPGQTIADNSNANVRIIGGGNDISLGAALTMIHTLAATNEAAATIAFGGQTLRLGTNGGILLAPTSGGLTIGSTLNDGLLTAGGTSNGAAGELIFINNS